MNFQFWLRFTKRAVDKKTNDFKAFIELKGESSISTRRSEVNFCFINLKVFSKENIFDVYLEDFPNCGSESQKQSIKG